MLSLLSLMFNIFEFQKKANAGFILPTYIYLFSHILYIYTILWYALLFRLTRVLTFPHSYALSFVTKDI